MNESRDFGRGQQVVLSIHNVGDIVVQLAVGALFVWAAYRILGPFVPLVVWGGVLAIAVYPVFRKLGSRLGGRRKLAATLLVLLGIAIIVAPVIAVSASVVETAHDLGEEVDKGTLRIPPPPPRVKSWPVIGTRTDEIWRMASNNLQRFAETYGAQIKPVVSGVLSATAGAGVVALQLVVSVLIAGVLMFHGEVLSGGIDALFDRIFGEQRGTAFRDLSAKTIRSVATGVLGVAFIQALLAFVGMAIAGIPYSGAWSVLVLVLAIIQLPPAIVLLPIAIWFFGSTASQVVAWAFLVWALLVSVSDAVLKPLLLGRGVEAPMLVILLGAIGGMILYGIIGLFLGAVALALFYQLLKEWLSRDGEMPPTEPSAETAES